MACKNYFDITQVEDVTPEIITAYKKLIRRERYLTEKDNKHITYQYGSVDELYSFGLLSPTQGHCDNSQHLKQVKLLYKSLRMLRRLNRRDYNIVMDYFFPCENEKISYNKLAKRYGVSKQTIHNIIKRSLFFLKKALLWFEENSEIE